MTAPRKTAGAAAGDYSHRIVPMLTDQLGRRPTITELLVTALEPWVVDIAAAADLAGQPRPGAHHEVLAELIRNVRCIAPELNRRQRGHRGKAGAVDYRTLRWCFYLPLKDGTEPLFWAYQREFLGPNGEQLDHIGDARALMALLHGAPDDLSTLPSEDAS